MKRFAFSISLLIALFIPFTSHTTPQDIEDVCEKMEDANFMAYCYDEFDINKDGKVSLSEAAAAREIIIYQRDIYSLKGIEYFVNVTILDCTRNEITELDLSNNTKLRKVNCSNNKITSLSVSGCMELSELSCDNNKLTYIDLSNAPILKKLKCSNNNLVSLDLSNNPMFYELNCWGNPINTIFWGKGKIHSYHINKPRGCKIERK